MADTVRTFIAIPIPSSPKLDRVANELKALGGPIRLVERNSLHLTLSFLGETPWSRVADVGSIVAEVCSRHTCIEVSLEGIDAFPHTRQARVVWSGLTPGEPLKRLARDLSHQLGEAGFPPEGRGFVPHVTLARIKGKLPPDFPDWVSRHAAVSFGHLHLERVVLFQSELSRQGPVYTVLSEHELNEEGRLSC